MLYLRLFFNTVFIDQAVVSGSRFLMTLIIARCLGVSEYGVYVILWSYILFIASIQTPLIINPLMTMCAKKKNRNEGKLFSFFLIFQSLFTVASFCILILIYWVSSFFYSIYSFKVFIAIVFYGIIYNFFEFLRKYLLCSFNDKDVLVYDGAVYASVFVAIFGLIYFDVTSLINLAIFLGCIYFIAVMIILTRINWVKIDKKYFISKFKDNYNFSHQMIKQSIMQFFSGHFFLYVSVYFLGVYSSGVIGILKNLFGPLLVLLMFIESHLPRLVAQKHEKSFRSLKQFIKKYLFLFMVGVSVFSLIIIIFSNNIITTFYGSEYSQYSNYLYWFAFSHLFMFITKVLSVYCRATNILKVFFIQGVYSLLLSVMFTIPAVLYFNLNGAFFIMTLQQFVISFIALKSTKLLKWKRILNIVTLK